MKLKRLISCGLVGILAGVGILMNAKVSSAEDKSVKFEFKSNSSDSSSQITTIANLKTEITSGNADLISAIKASTVYAGKQGLKFGSGKSNGSLMFTLNQNYKINQFKVGIAKYNDKDGGKVKIQCGEYSEEFTPESSVLELDGKSFISYETNTFTISTTAKRAYVKSIEFLYNNAETCTVAYYDGADVISTFTVDKGTILDETNKPANPTKEENVFVGWYTEPELKNEYKFDLPVTADLKLYAKFEAAAAVETQTVTFMKDAEKPFNTSVVKKGNTVGVPAEPTKDGYSFAGWYTDVNCTTAYDFDLPVNTDITLYAKWLAKYTVSFDTDGGSTVESQTVVTGNKATKPAVIPTKKGYNFVAWYTDNTYTTEFDFENTIITDNTTIYAKFEDASIIRLNGYTFNKISTLEELTTGYYVIGGFDGTNYAYMNDVFDKKGFGTENKPSVYYTFYNKAGKVKIQKSQNEYLSALGGSPKNFGIVDNRKEAYEFVPQMIDDELQIRLDETRGSNVIAYNKSASRIKPYASISTTIFNITLFKAQNVKPFYVTFKGPNNEELNKEEMLPHQKAPEFEAPNKPGHKFMGWYNEATDAKYDFTTELSEETVLVAKYEALTPAELFEQLEIKNQLAYHWQTEDSTTYTIDNVSLRFGVNLTEEMKSLEGVKFGAILAKKADVVNINLSEDARKCTSAAEVVGKNEKLKYLEFTNIAAEGGMTSLRLDNLDSALDEKFVVVIYMEYNGKLYVTEQKIASVKVIASEYLDKKVDLDLTDDQIKSLNQLSK